MKARHIVIMVFQDRGDQENITMGMCNTSTKYLFQHSFIPGESDIEAEEEPAFEIQPEIDDGSGI